MIRAKEYSRNHCLKLVSESIYWWRFSFQPSVQFTSGGSTVKQHYGDNCLHDILLQNLIFTKPSWHLVKILSYFKILEIFFFSWSVSLFFCLWWLYSALLTSKLKRTLKKGVTAVLRDDCGGGGPNGRSAQGLIRTKSGPGIGCLWCCIIRTPRHSVLLQLAR